MNNNTANNLATSIFNKIMKAKSPGDLSQIIKNTELLRKNQMDKRGYPTLELTLTSQDINKLKESRLIDSDNLLIEDLSAKELSPLEKLLYSIIWKNGDIKKERHIIEGIESVKTIGEKKSGFVFFQFGKHLAKRTEPIIDQHVLRAFGLFYCKKNDEDTLKLRRKSAINKSDLELIEQYKNWLISENLTKELLEYDNYTFHIDKVLFALGKSIKVTKRTKL